jgi:putative membrane protein
MALSNRLLTLSLGFAAALVSAAGAQGVPAPPGSTPRAPQAALPTAPASVSMTVQESEVLDRLHAAHVVEIAAAKLAQQHAGSDDVKRYGEHLIKDHERAERDLQAFAVRNTIKLAEVDARALEPLKDLHGSEFDRAFLSMMVKDHQSAIARVRSAQPRAANKDIRKLLERALPALQRDETEAQHLAAGLS